MEKHEGELHLHSKMLFFLLVFCQCHSFILFPQSFTLHSGAIYLCCSWHLWLGFNKKQLVESGGHGDMP